MAKWSGTKPVVSILCATYNHEAYIKNAIEGFLLQETSFPFEVIIHEDVSTDTTADIVQSYFVKYPNIIKPIFQKENQYSKGASPLLNALAHAQGDYIAICEGDDYWTDPLKLNIQFDYLVSHKNFSMHAHSVQIIDNTVSGFVYTPYTPALKSINSFNDILREHFIPTLSLMIRRECIPNPMPSFIYKVRSRDIALELMISSKGPCFFSDKKMGVYRHHDGGITKTPIHPLKERAMRYTLYKGLLDYLGKSYQRRIRQKLAWIDLAAVAAILSTEKRLDIKLIITALLKDPFVIIRIITRKIHRFVYLNWINIISNRNTLPLK